MDTFRITETAVALENPGGKKLCDHFELLYSYVVYFTVMFLYVNN